MRPISIGNQSFESLIEEKAFYIDKTSFIKEWWENLDVVTLIMRPRRFGKTLNMQMLECFFSNRYKDRGDLFEGLDIWKEEKYRLMQGQYPVIFLSFANVKETNAADAIYRICSILSQLYREYDFLLDSKRLSKAEKNKIEKYESSISKVEAEDSLGFLSGVLEKHFSKKVIILLDEYDTPLQEAYVDGYWDQMSSFVRALFNSTFKTNPSMQRALMTGITRVSKESIFSDLNNLTVASLTSEQYETSFGFTQSEVSESLKEYGLADQSNEVKKWYDGFTVGSTTDIYNPWSITNYLKYRQFGAYWANTSGNSLISYELRSAESDTKDQMQSLLEGQTVNARIDEQVVYSQLDGDADALWSFFDTKRQVSDERRPESFYHGLLLGMVAQESEYHIESNGENGYGRYDIMMLPTKQSIENNSHLPAMILEFKILNPDLETSLSETATRALEQIESKKYEAKAIDMGYRSDQILKYGLGFSGKEAVVKKK